MLAIPIPLPDELSRSFQGRLMRMNGVTSDREMIERLAGVLGVAEQDRRKVTATDILSLAAGMAIEKFVCQHTLIPLKRGINSYLPDLPHGASGSQGVLFLSGPRLVRQHPYFCADCVRADLDRYGVSYWHREHQLPGVLLCARHRTPLRYADGDADLLRPPSQCAHESREVSCDWLDGSEGHAGVRRFLCIQDGLMDTRRPYPVTLVSARLKVRAKSRGLLTYPGRRPRAGARLLSDLVKESFPKGWLSTVFPALAAKLPGTSMSQMDGVLYLANSSAASTVYALACAVLYDSADEALADFATALVTTRGLKSLQRRAVISDDAYREAYFRHGGVYRRAAMQLSVTVQSAARRLQRLGLPDMKESGQGPVRKALFAFFVRGLDFSSAAAAGGIPVSSLETAVRQAGGNVEVLLRKLGVNGMRGRPGRGRERATVVKDLQSDAL